MRGLSAGGLLLLTVDCVDYNLGYGCLAVSVVGAQPAGGAATPSGNVSMFAGAARRPPFHGELDDKKIG